MFANSGSNNNGNKQRFKNIAEDVLLWGTVGVLVAFGGKGLFKKYKEQLKQKAESNVTVNPEEMPRDTIFMSEAVFNSANGHIENGAYDDFELKKYGQNGVDSVLVEISQEVEYEPTSGIVRIEKGRRVIHPDDEEIIRSAVKSAKYAPVAEEDGNMKLVSIQTQKGGPVIRKNKIEQEVEEDTPVTYGAEGRSGGKKTHKETKETLIAKEKTIFTYQVIKNTQKE